MTGLSLAREEAYETDWGMSMLATVTPASKSPEKLGGDVSVRRGYDSAIGQGNEGHTENTNTGVSMRSKGYNISCASIVNVYAIAVGDRWALGCVNS